MHEVLHLVRSVYSIHEQCDALQIGFALLQQNMGLNTTACQTDTLLILPM